MWEYKENELYHYGVIGMRWGIHRGRADKAYAKASKKLSRLNKKVEKANAKARKKAYKAEKKDMSWIASDKSVDKAKRKARKSSYKAAKKMRKAKKWYDQMEKAFAETDIKMTSEQIALGRKYTHDLDMRQTIKAATY